MPRERLPMRKIRDVLRLHAGGLSKRRIAASLTIGRTAVGDYIRRAKRAGLGWPRVLRTKIWIACCSRRRRLFIRGDARPPTGRRCIANSSGPASPCRCCGKNTAPSTRMVMATANSARAIGLGKASST